MTQPSKNACEACIYTDKCSHQVKDCKDPLFNERIDVLKKEGGEKDD